MHKILCLIMNAGEVWMNIVNMIMKFIFEGRIINIWLLSCKADSLGFAGKLFPFAHFFISARLNDKKKLSAGLHIFRVDEQQSFVA